MNKIRLLLLAAAVFLTVTALVAVWDAPPLRSSGTTATTRPTAVEKIDVNTADEATLAAVPGITPEMASAIVAKRDRIGRYENLYQLDDIDGMTAKKWKDITQYLTVLPENP